MLVFSSAQITNSSSSSGSPSNTRAYRSNATAALAAKSGSRGKIQERCNHGRMASRCSTRHTVAAEIAATTARVTSSRASSAQLHRDNGTPVVAGSSQANSLTSATTRGGKRPGSTRTLPVTKTDQCPPRRTACAT